MIGAVAARDHGTASRVRRTGLALTAVSVTLFLGSLGFILLGWWGR
ncbi:MAG: hypothetical protein HYY25_14560 [Candidatus Wallbacteria bacterium]|nr:hypothetical protein [Candidatus Wallbacteria bacterium]